MVFTIPVYGHSGNLGHVTWTIYINFCSPFLRMLHMKFGFDWPSGFRRISNTISTKFSLGATKNERYFTPFQAAYNKVSNC